VSERAVKGCRRITGITELLPDDDLLPVANANTTIAAIPRRTTALSLFFHRCERLLALYQRGKDLERAVRQRDWVHLNSGITPWFARSHCCTVTVPRAYVHGTLNRPIYI
jgi:hypothetical protein